MAKSSSQQKRPEDSKITSKDFPSVFGSHRSMIDEEATKALNKVGRVILKDENGNYETDENRLDTGLADPNRYVSSRLSVLFGDEKVQ